MRLAGFILIVLFAAALPNRAWAQDTPAERLHALFAEEWQARQTRNPIWATLNGEHRYNDRLPDVSPQAQASYAEQDRHFLDRLAAIDRAGLSPGDRVSAELFGFDLTRRLDQARFETWRMPFSSDSGFHTELARLVEATPFATAEDRAAYLTRLRALPGYIDQQIANMRQGLADGFTQPREILDKVAPTFAALAVDKAENSVFAQPILSAAWPDNREVGLSVVREAVLPALAKLSRFFQEKYIPGARTSLGATSLPQGEAYYAAQIRAYTTLERTPQEIHKIGLQEVARIRSQMRAIIDEVGFQGSFKDFLTFLRSDPQFYADSPEALLKEAAHISKRIDEKLPAYFGTLPRMPYGVRAVPDDIAPNYTTGRYWPAIPGKRGGLFMVNTYALDKRPLYALPALALHEGVPGHHLQISLAQEQPGLPAFRRELYLSAFGEGWGLYAEALGEEMGIYRTPYERFGRLTYEMWRAGRLVVDTGLHAMGWNRARAVDFFIENSALSEHNINTEVDRYISWPGQALSYKLGELKILELRRRAEDVLGERFDLRAFHDAVLRNGAVTLPLLDAQIAAFIQNGGARDAAD
ncbi:MAG: DUF885 family protein [Rhodothalassiaceae bacterium]